MKTISLEHANRIYQLDLSLRFATFTTPSDSSIAMYKYAGSVVFQTPEIAPNQAPQITAAYLQNTLITIDWLLPGQCPGLIRSYDAEVLCDAHPTSDLQPENSGNISFDCRSHMNGTQLQAHVPTSCKNSRNLKVQVNHLIISQRGNNIIKELH